MKIFLLMSIVTLIVFTLYKLILVLVTKILNKLIKYPRDNNSSFNLFTSIAIQLVFLSVWWACIVVVAHEFEMSDLVGYVSFCMIGAFCVIWCYFSWDVEHFFVKPCKAKPEHRRLKKIILYSLILLFVVCQGYFQTLHALDTTIEVNVIFSITNYSVVVATIALDRLMNQICS